MLMLTLWGILAYLLFLFIVVLPFDISLRRNTRISLLGTLDPRRVDGRLAWILASGIVGSLVLLLHMIVFLLCPQSVERVLLFQSRPLGILGLVMIASSAVLEGVAIAQLGRHYLLTEGGPSLITSGAYSVCRNPVYVSMALGFLGVFFMLPTGSYLSFYVLYLLGNHVRALREERHLCMRFGEEYRTYCQSVGRYWPRSRS